MVGKDGGVKYLNNYKPPESLRVIKLEGPFNEEGEKVTVLKKGKSYKYKVTEFNRELRNEIELKRIKWSLQNNGENLISISQVMGKKEVTLSVSETESSKKITIYAYFENPEEEGVAESSLGEGGIHTRFYDEQGQQVYEIPEKLHKAFNKEYGIKIAYDKENEMLYYEGECTPAYEKTSPTAINHWKKELNREQISKGKLLFGYSYKIQVYSKESKIGYNEEGYPLSYNETSDAGVFFGEVPSFYKEETRIDKDTGKSYKISKVETIGNIACIDLDDYDEELMAKYAYYELPSFDYEQFKEFNIPLPKLTCRYNGLARGLEHEFIGHVLLKLSDHTNEVTDEERGKLGPTPVEARFCNLVRREIDVPDRKTYAGIAINPSRVGRSEIKFGYLNGSDGYYKSDVDSRNTNYPNPPKKYPRYQGTVIISAQNVTKLFLVKNIIKIKYDVQQKGFTFS